MHEEKEECILVYGAVRVVNEDKTDVDAEMKKTDGRKRMVSEKMNEEKHLVKRVDGGIL